MSKTVDLRKRWQEYFNSINLEEVKKECRENKARALWDDEWYGQCYLGKVMSISQVASFGRCGRQIKLAAIK